jgi:hypothetical protein
MFGISASIFNEAGSLVRDWLKNPLNTSFFYWYFLPITGFILLQLFFVGPALGRPAPNILSVDVQHSTSVAELALQIFSASFFQLIVLPLVGGFLLSALSGRVLRLYQGTLPILAPLFKPWLSRNRRRNTFVFGRLRVLRRQFLFLATQGVRLQIVDGEEVAQFVPENERAALIDQLKADTQAFHEQLEQDTKAPDLPVDIDRVGATALANTLALAEEYPFERYAIDAAVFWPRLSVEIEPEKLEGLKSGFAAMNGFLNLSLLFYLFAIESMVLAMLTLTRSATVAAPLAPLSRVVPALAFGMAVVSLLLGFGAYRSAVASARAVGNSMRTAFDYYRGNVLRRFNLRMPHDIDDERVVWLKLAAFIRRGESFYYPTEFRGDDPR